MAYDNPTPEVLAIGELFDALQPSEWLVNPRSWYDVVKFKGKTEFVSVSLLSLITDPFWIKGKWEVLGFKSDDARRAVIWKNVKQWSDALGLSLRQSTRGLDILIACGLIEEQTIDPNSAVELLKKKIPQKVNLEGINKTCQWCKATTFLLQEHHYPIARKDGGEKTVSICPSCHYEFHHLIKTCGFKLTEKCIELCENSFGGAE